ncbi:mitochondrial carrier protein RIM2, partial [Magnaporthiopsis poae ATCC 64411]
MSHHHSTATLAKGFAGENAINTTQLTQSRENGGAISIRTVHAGKVSPFAASWSHFVAGGMGGMTAAALTAPLDVLKTRLQSDFYQQQVRQHRVGVGSFGGGITGPLRLMRHHLGETFSILGAVYQQEGPRALFKGLGPNLIGVVPARSIQFFTYGNTKQLLTTHVNHGREAGWVIHLVSAIAAGVVTSTATNPIWLIKTRLQLDKSVALRSGAGLEARKYR